MQNLSQDISKRLRHLQATHTILIQLPATKATKARQADSPELTSLPSSQPTLVTINIRITISWIRYVVVVSSHEDVSFKMLLFFFVLRSCCCCNKPSNRHRISEFFSAMKSSKALSSGDSMTLAHIE